MVKKEKDCDCKPNKVSTVGGGVYCLGALGAAVYFIQNAESFWWGVFGVLKALVWPAVLVYKLLESVS